jgi:hypothetical protein
VAEESVGRVDLDHLDDVSATVSVSDDEVQVTIRASVDHIFSGAVPGGAERAEVAATAVADAERG